MSELPNDSVLIVWKKGSEVKLHRVLSTLEQVPKEARKQLLDEVVAELLGEL